MKMERAFGWPNIWTFKIKPIAKLLAQELDGGLWLDPMAGYNSPADITNDLDEKAPTDTHINALDFLKLFGNELVDGVIFDPPYTIAQSQENYGGRTFKKTITVYRNEIARVIRNGGKCISFWYNSFGLGKWRGFNIERILLVNHGPNKYDTIVTVERKVQHKLTSF